VEDLLPVETLEEEEVAGEETTTEEDSEVVEVEEISVEEEGSTTEVDTVEDLPTTSTEVLLLRMTIEDGWEDTVEEEEEEEEEGIEVALLDEEDLLSREGTTDLEEDTTRDGVDGMIMDTEGISRVEEEGGEEEELEEVTEGIGDVDTSRSIGGMDLVSALNYLLCFVLESWSWKGSFVMRRVEERKLTFVFACSRFAFRPRRLRWIPSCSLRPAAAARTWSLRSTTAAPGTSSSLRTAAWTWLRRTSRSCSFFSLFLPLPSCISLFFSLFSPH